MHEAAAFLPLTDDQQVDARSLYGWLGIGAAFNVWMLRILRDYSFEEGPDFRSSVNKSTGGRPRKDYLLSLDVAKEIAMIGNTPKGKATRRYFIAAEKAAAKMASGGVEEGRASAILRRHPALTHSRYPSLRRTGRHGSATAFRRPVRHPRNPSS
ncbi:antA/AntB antirepressor family protein [Sphingopyxis terrae]|uniref:antA/AntB antirepressor family protein n=1 Tax=Sphingopyxis terrae TaxID=33052 RepID=UPI003F814982